MVISNPHSALEISGVAANTNAPENPTCTEIATAAPDAATHPRKDACRDTLVEIGFTLEEEGTTDDEDGKLPFSLVMSRVDSIDRPSINGITLELVRLAGEHRGDYDGWGCEATVGTAGS